MGFRTVVIHSHCKLEYSLNYLIYRGEIEKKIHLSEIETIVIQSTAVALTTSLISELVNRKIKLVFCDSKNNPQSEILPLYGSFDTSKKINDQISWGQSIKDDAWKEIIKRKISFQANLLKKFSFEKESELLETYIGQVESGDPSNREGHAAKVYFNVIFGNGFSRQSSNVINTYLNYGYSLILSAFNREIVSFGYLTQIGIHHRNNENEFNLSCDFMEPFRLLVDQYILEKDVCNETFKSDLLNIFQSRVFIDGKYTFFDTAINIYCQSLLSFLNGNYPRIKFPDKYEL